MTPRARRHPAGGPGSDAPQTFNVPGFSLHRELEALQQAGLRPYDILLGGTRGGAEHLRRVGVTLRGRWLPAAAPDSLPAHAGR